MKRMIMLFGWMLIVCTAASGQTRFLEQVDWGTPSVVKQGENVRVKVDIRLDAMRLKIQQALRLVPVIVSADGSQEAALQPVVIEGRVRFRVTERKQALGTWEEAEGTVHLWRENGKEQTVLFSTIRYCDAVKVFPEGDAHYIYSKRAILFSGIANDTPLRSYLAGKYRITGHMKFADHHRFTKADIRMIGSAASGEPTAVIVTTEKDAQRLRETKEVPEILRKRMFQVPIEAVFLTEHETAIYRQLLKNLL